MNRLSIHVEPIHGTNFAKVRTFSNERLGEDAERVREIGASLLEGTHLPAEYQATASVALTWLFDGYDVTRVIISDIQDGWQADIRLIIQNAAKFEAFYGRGHAATPADAIRAALWCACHAAR
jgi:hypothetical protein